MNERRLYNLLGNSAVHLLLVLILIITSRPPSNTRCQFVLYVRERTTMADITLCFIYVCLVERPLFAHHSYADFGSRQAEQTYWVMSLDEKPPPPKQASLLQHNRRNIYPSLEFNLRQGPASDGNTSGGPISALGSHMLSPSFLPAQRNTQKGLA